MAILKSAKKALRQSIKRRTINIVYKDKIKNLLKEVKSLVSQKKINEAGGLLPQIYKALDKAAKRGVIKRNTASRQKSRITRFIEKATQNLRA